jgi:hypothetical protein
MLDAKGNRSPPPPDFSTIGDIPGGAMLAPAGAEPTEEKREVLAPCSFSPIKRRQPVLENSRPTLVTQMHSVKR